MDYFSSETILICGIIVGIALTLTTEFVIAEFRNR
jgi:uncharacterized membrane protein (DUF106 family)